MPQITAQDRTGREIERGFCVAILTVTPPVCSASSRKPLDDRRGTRLPSAGREKLKMNYVKLNAAISGRRNNVGVFRRAERVQAIGSFSSTMRRSKRIRRCHRRTDRGRSAVENRVPCWHLPGSNAPWAAPESVVKERSGARSLQT